jgi:hemerythrin-like domain-containing protein
MELKIPESLELEHEELHEQLFKGIKEGGKVGEAAKAVADILHPHFEKEEEYALPPLGLLSFLLSEDQGEDKIIQEMKNNVIFMTDKLKADLSHMIEEHNEIVDALNNLIELAKIKNKTELVQFAEKLKLHAKTEEQVLYPTAILIGKYLKLLQPQTYLNDLAKESLPFISQTSVQGIRDLVIIKTVHHKLGLASESGHSN